MAKVFHLKSFLETKYIVFTYFTENTPHIKDSKRKIKKNNFVYKGKIEIEKTTNKTCFSLSM